MSLKYEPASELLHICVKQLFSNCAQVVLTAALGALPGAPSFLKSLQANKVRTFPASRQMNFGLAFRGVSTCALLNLHSRPLNV